MFQKPKSSLPNYRLVLENTAFLLFFIVFTGYSQVKFAPYETYKTGSRANVVCIGDINNDGLNDIVVGTGYDLGAINNFKILIYLQDNSGNLALPLKYSYADSYPGISSISIADLNNDGLNDVAIGYSDSIGIFYQNNSGSLNQLKSYSCSNDNNTILSISTGDLNNDGLTDIVASFSKNEIIKVLYQIDTGGFKINEFPAPQGAYNEIKIADVNNDKLNDVVLLTNTATGEIHIFTQNNTGTLDNFYSYTTSNLFSMEGIDVGDLNNDGKNDMVGTIGGNKPYSKIALFFQDSETSLMKTPPTQIPAYDCPEPIRISDLNCDGLNDIIVVHGGWQTISIYEQNADGIYDTYTKLEIPYATSYYNHGISIGDINNDSKKDIVIVDYGGNMHVLYNLSTLFGYCCSLPVRPLLPKGDTLICSDEINSLYKSRSDITEFAKWNILPHEAGTIIFSNNDSCKIAWNKSWKGIGGIYLTVRNNCATRNSDTLHVTSDRLPAVSLGNDTALCSNQTKILDAGANFYSYKWHDGSSNQLYKVDKGGNYSVQVENICGFNSDSIFITMLPVSYFNLHDTTICSNETAEIDISQPDAISYLWQDNSTSPIYTISAPGTYSVTITNNYGCQSTSSFFARLCKGNVDIPTAFSPNGDGINDYLIPFGRGVQDIHLVIYNRWGQIVFETNNIEESWDGTFHGKQLNTGVFIYTLTARSVISGETIEKSGNITLIR